jgi:hypothetical protein
MSRIITNFNDIVSCILKPKKGEERGIATAAFSAVGPNSLGHGLEQKQAQKVRTAKSFFVVHFKVKYVGNDDFNQFLLDITSFFFKVYNRCHLFIFLYT